MFSLLSRSLNSIFYNLVVLFVQISLLGWSGIFGLFVCLFFSQLFSATKVACATCILFILCIQRICIVYCLFKMSNFILPRLSVFKLVIFTSSYNSSKLLFGVLAINILGSFDVLLYSLQFYFTFHRFLVANNPTGNFLTLQLFLERNANVERHLQYWGLS